MKRPVAVESASASIDEKLAQLTSQGALYSFRATGDDGQIGLRGPVGDGAALFPIAKRAQGNSVPRGEFLLCQTQSAANHSDLRRPFHAPEIGGSQRADIRIGQSRAFNGAWCHRSKQVARTCSPRSAALPPETSKSRGPKEQVRARFVMNGRGYNESINFPNSGTASAPITFESYPVQMAVVDGTGLSPSGTLLIGRRSTQRSYPADRAGSQARRFRQRWPSASIALLHH